MMEAGLQLHGWLGSFSAENGGMGAGQGKVVGGNEAPVVVSTAWLDLFAAVGLL